LLVQEDLISDSVASLSGIFPYCKDICVSADQESRKNMLLPRACYLLFLPVDQEGGGI